MKPNFFQTLVLLSVTFLLSSATPTKVLSDTKIAGTSCVVLAGWSSDGILFSTSKDNDFFDIHRISPDGANEIALTSEGGLEIGKYSSDGARIYYILLNPEGPSFWKMKSDATNKRKIFQLGSEYLVFWDFALSPDDSKCVYTRQDITDDSYSRWVINTDGSNNTELTNAGCGEYGLDFSPDGEWVLFVSTTNHICKIRTDNTGLTELTTTYAYNPDWSPDGSKIVYVDFDGLYVIDPDGSNKTKISSAGEHPLWSPDSNWIVYGSNQIWVIDKTGTEKKQLMPSHISSYDYAWDPTSTRIVFSESQNIYTINRDGTGYDKITNNILPSAIDCPELSGDAKKVAYFADGPEEFETGLFVVNNDGSGRTVVSPYGYYYSWAPHPTKLLYSDDTNGHIYYYSVETNSNVELSTGPCYKTPIWSPSLGEIAYVSNSILTTMDADGTNIKPIASATGDLSYSPDGNKIVYKYNNDIWLINLQNSTTVQLTTDNGDTWERNPVFSPDATKIAYTTCVTSPFQWKLWTMNADGSDKQVVYSPPSGQMLSGCLWKSDNKIYFAKGMEYLMGQLYSINPDGTGLEAKSPEEVPVLFDVYQSYDVSTNGKVCVYGVLGLWVAGEPLVTRPEEGEIKVVGSTEGRGTINPERGDKALIFFTGSQAGTYNLRIFTQLGELIYEDTKEADSKEGWFEWVPESIASGMYLAHVEGPGISKFAKLGILR